MTAALDDRVGEVLGWLEESGSEERRAEMEPRYGIVAPKSFGVAMSTLKALGKRLGRDHELAEALWATGWYEARMLTSFVDDPARVTPEQMERWAGDFDNWGICDTLCFNLFDRAPHAWAMVDAWSNRSEEFVKRAAFALLASLAAHDRRAGDEAFLRALPLAERAAGDDRNFVKKGVSWGLRATGRRNLALNVATLEVARRLAASSDAAARWVGKDVAKELTRADVQAQLAARAGKG